MQKQKSESYNSVVISQKRGARRWFSKQGKVRQTLPFEMLEKGAGDNAHSENKSFAQPQKCNKVWRALACGCLAVLMCGTAFLGTACSGGSSADINAGGGNAGSNASGVNQTGASNLIFDDTSAPVFTTQSGVEIRYANANPSVGIDNTKGCYYFDLGTFNGTTIRWLILGIGTKNPPTDPAGAAIGAEIQKETFALFDKNNTVEYGNFICCSASVLHAGQITCTALNTYTGAGAISANSLIFPSGTSVTVHSLVPNLYQTTLVASIIDSSLLLFDYISGSTQFRDADCNGYGGNLIPKHNHTTLQTRSLNSSWQLITSGHLGTIGGCAWGRTSFPFSVVTDRLFLPEIIIDLF